MEKSDITEGRLRRLIMDEVRKHPECDHVTGVAFIKPPQLEPYHPNWQPAWVRKGFGSAPAIAWVIAREFQNKFNLV